MKVALCRRRKVNDKEEKIMKKFWIWLLVAAMVGAISVSGCAPQPTPTAPPEEAAEEAEELPEETTEEVAEEAAEEAAEELPEEIVIGVYLPVTGAFAAGGQMELEGIEFAHKLHPEVLGKPVRLVFCDNKSDKVEAATCMSRLIEREKVHAVLGSYGSSLSIAGGEIAEAAKMPVLGTSPTSPLVTEGRDYYFRVVFIDPVQGKVAAKFLVEEYGAEKVAVLFDIAQDPTTGGAMFFRDYWVELTGSVDGIVAFENYRTGDSDFTAQLTHIKGLNPDAVLIPAYYGEAALIVKQAREMGITCPFIGFDGLEAPEFMEIGGEDVEGTYCTTHYSHEANPTDAAVEFVKLWEEEFDRPPSALEAVGYDTYMVMRYVIEQAGKPDPELIREGLEGLTDYEGVTSVITLDEDHNAIKSAVVKQVRDGEWRYVTTIAPWE
jgi:branched-chain amino acid transport system substrate-binding protein